MKNLEIHRTINTPEVYFESNGNFVIEGRLVSENIISFFKPLYLWIENITCERINLKINLEYLNSSASKQLFTFIKKLEENCNIKDFKVKWYFEEQDEVHLETGKYYNECLKRTQFEFLMSNEYSKIN